MKLCLVLLMALLLAACNSVQPPKRPVAYMYPSMRPLSALTSYVPVEATEEEICRALQSAGVYAPLQEAGLQAGDLLIVARGLAKHGYAEIDARRTDCKVKIAAVYNNAEGLMVDARWR